MNGSYQQWYSVFREKKLCPPLPYCRQSAPITIQPFHPELVEGQPSPDAPGAAHRNGGMKQVAGVHRGAGKVAADGVQDFFILLPGDGVLVAAQHC